MSKRSVFFPGLNELRAIAAFSVLAHHIELYKFREGMPSLYSIRKWVYFIDSLGLNGVLLFFTLSGFLVTYLLFQEKEEPDGIQIIPFYVRRMLRIWPLYFISLFIGFGLIPLLYGLFPEFFMHQNFYNNLINNIQYGTNFLLYFFFLSNLALDTYGGVAGASQNWSVSMEEQFYLVWPWIIKYSGRFLILILVAIILFGNFCVIVKPHFHSWIPNSILRNFFLKFDFDFMAFGALAALAYRRFPNQIFRLFKNPVVLIVLGVVLVYHLEFLGIRALKAISFCGVILTVIVWKFSFKPLDWSGKISYGLYMYHPFVMYITFSVLSHLDLPKFWISPFLYLVIPGLTIGISLLSYKYIELAFLRRKKKFSSVQSGSIEV